MRSPFAPSASLPDYLKAQLQVGEAGQWPLLTALDEMLEGIGNQALVRVFDLVSASTSLPRREQELKSLGWQIEALSLAGREQLYEERHRILEARGTLMAVEILSQIYFREGEVSLGRPLAPSRLGQSASVKLVDRKDRRQIVFVRTTDVYSQKLCQEFCLNAGLLLPHPFEVVLGFPRKTAAAVQKITLAAAQCWDGRRVPCLISRK